ncbi:MAG TPA: TlpA family protein disulfide reductase [Anaerolineae bacterium]|nr:TlpA family protein disulfide reductase [Anaerolineae bacterium]HID85504.1 TlpA family protein disulfide reductase [Anaerolineales bacterium]HIQ09666.1 TlpA family protein disulfide reductase [Anaerolineaceae bacterium]
MSGLFPVTRHLPLWLGRVALLLAAALWVWASRTTPQAVTQGQVPAPQVGFLAPDFILPTLEGGSQALSDLRGQVVVLNFWASWCPPCRAEMPTLARVAQEYAPKRVTVLAINATASDSSEAARRFLAEIGVTLPVVLDLDGQVVQTYRISAFPTTFFVDAQGVIRDIVVGGPLSEASLRARLDALIQEVP